MSDITPLKMVIPITGDPNNSECSSLIMYLKAKDKRTANKP